jgi:hypothetical protein
MKRLRRLAATVGVVMGAVLVMSAVAAGGSAPLTTAVSASTSTLASAAVPNAAEVQAATGATAAQRQGCQPPQGPFHLLFRNRKSGAAPYFGFRTDDDESAVVAAFLSSAREFWWNGTGTTEAGDEYGYWVTAKCKILSSDHSCKHLILETNHEDVGALSILDYDKDSTGHVYLYMASAYCNSHWKVGTIKEDWSGDENRGNDIFAHTVPGLFQKMTWKLVGSSARPADAPVMGAEPITTTSHAPTA